jgi:4-amino-4-deoxy-L-arabinose transferase-like glycosyltransferase
VLGRGNDRHHGSLYWLVIVTLTSDRIESDLPAAGDLRPYPTAPWRLYGVVAVAFFAVAIVPTLGWLEFANGSENLVTESVLEIKRGGSVLVPDLEGQPRIAKPPLTTWIEALAVPRELIARLDAPGESTRWAAYAELAIRLRLVALASTVLMLLAVGELGRTIGDGRLGLLSLLIAASSVLVLRFGRYATTDVQLALWVTVANWMLARAALRGKWFSGLSLAGAALGLAMMSKGPVCLVQTVLPVGCFLIWRRASNQSLKGAMRGAVTGLLLFAAIGLPWFIWVAAHVPAVWSPWFSEVTRRYATDIEPGPWFSYFSIVPYVLPFSAYLLAGLAMAVIAIRRRDGQSDGLILAAMLGVMPLLVMSLAKDKNERYELPMIGPMAIVAAFALQGALRKRRVIGTDRALIIIHCCLVAATVIALAVAGGWILRDADGQFWFGSDRLAVLFVIATLTLISIPLLIRRPWRLADSTLLAALVVQAIFFSGYCKSPDALSPLRPMAELIRNWERTGVLGGVKVWYFDPRPAAASHGQYARRRAPVDLSIYLNQIVPTSWDPGVTFPADLTWPDRQIAVVLQRPDEPAPWVPPDWPDEPGPRVPPDWTELFSTNEPGTGSKSARIWRAYLLPSRPRSSE